MLIKEFFDFMQERHAIYERKKAGQPYPWTGDPILRQYKFCNVFRELDTGTVWCREHIREPYADETDLFFNIAAYRNVNDVGTWNAVCEAEQAWTGVPFITLYDAERVKGVMWRRKAAGLRVFTNAHMLTGLHCGDKVVQFADITCRFLWDHRSELEPQPGDNLKAAFDRLIKARIPAVGKFLAYEIITDLRHTRYLENADDIYWWANLGNGAKRGIERVLGIYKQGVNRKYEDGYLEAVMIDLLHESAHRYLPKSFPKLEMRDIEHTLCEFDKYWRTVVGESTPKMQYKPSEQVVL